MNNLQNSVTAKDAQILALQAQIAEKDKIISDARSGAGYTALPTSKRKGQSTDPAKFDGKDSPAERQQNFETFETKIRGVFDRDLDHFPTAKSRIGHISDLLEGKAWDYV